MGNILIKRAGDVVHTKVPKRKKSAVEKTSDGEEKERQNESKQLHAPQYHQPRHNISPQILPKFRAMTCQLGLKQQDVRWDGG